MRKYNEIVGEVMEFLNQNNYCQTVTKYNQRCFDELGCYLLKAKMAYTPLRAKEWFQSMKPSLSRYASENYRVALDKLQDVYETGHIRSGSPKRSRHLNDSMKNALNGYISRLRETQSPKTAETYRKRCLRFLDFVQKKGAESIHGISYGMICDFYSENNANRKRWDMLEENAVSAMFSYFFEKNEVPYGYTVINHYLSFGKGCFWNDIGQEAVQRVKDAQRLGTVIPVETFRSYCVRLRQLHVENGYGKSVLWAGDKVSNLLILFLDMNGYGYNPEAASAWFDGVRRHLGADSVAMKRSIFLLGQYHDGLGFNLEQVVGHKISRYSGLPLWYRETADGFMEMKRREGLKDSSIDSYRDCLGRFCSYLMSEGITSFREITALDIKKFNLYDRHKKASGKNSCNSRIKKFLIYLWENGQVSNPMFFAALTTAYASEESVVTILTDEEAALLNEKLADKDSGLSLRDRAMLLLGIRMGMRVSDVVNLKYSDINWKNQSIRFIQQKTGVEVMLPMPVDVGNAIFRYIMEERRKKSDPHLFLRARAPYIPVGSGACTQALEKALPDRDVAGSGFHVTRRTFATSLLRAGTGIDMVADALGHRGTGAVHRYLSLDDDRMLMCPISLQDYGIGGWDYEK